MSAAKILISLVLEQNPCRGLSPVKMIIMTKAFSRRHFPIWGQMDDDIRQELLDAVIVDLNIKVEPVTNYRWGLSPLVS